MVHTPIGLLIVGSFLLLLFQIWKNEKIYFSGVLLLGLGLPSGFLALWTGEIAYDKVGADLCDPEMLYQHERLAQITLAVYSVALVTIFVQRRLKKAIQIAAAKIALVAFLVTGIGLLSTAAHLGASLVYLQAAAVFRPDEQCSGF